MTKQHQAASTPNLPDKLEPAITNGYEDDFNKPVTFNNEAGVSTLKRPAVGLPRANGAVQNGINGDYDDVVTNGITSAKPTSMFNSPTASMFC